MVLATIVGGDNRYPTYALTSRRLRMEGDRGIMSGNRASSRRVVKNLRVLPRVTDSWSYLYVERARIDQEDFGICLHDERGRVHVPCASLSLLMLGPGTTVTHAAITTMADAGCLVAWCGEQGIRFYAQGLGETRSANNLLRQVRLWASPEHRLQIVYNMYAMRFQESLPEGLSLRQIRGMEGARVRAAYSKASEAYGVPWSGRGYNRRDWNQSDPINKALSAANACLYGVCHAAIVALGYSPALGFIHTGKMLSFVYDVGDLYKIDLTVPLAFEETAKGSHQLESRVRHRCRDVFAETRLLELIVDDLGMLFGSVDMPGEEPVDSDMALPGDLWDPEGDVSGGQNFRSGQ